jgi:nucleoside-diphosphate-sugar epimerase
MAKVTIFGAGGFVGTAVRVAVGADGHELDLAPAPRLAWDRPPRLDPGRMLAETPVPAPLIERLRGRDVVVNAAGLATPRSAATPELYGANSLWPLVLAKACEQAGVPRLIHVSSAAVQGRVAVLDERLWYGPVSPYAESKALAERLLLAHARSGGCRHGGHRPTIYRPTSVHGCDRALTRSFARFARRWPLVVTGEGDQPVPVCLVGNVGAGIAAVVRAPEPPAVALQPYEDLTVRSLYELFAAGRRIRRLPAGAVRRAVGRAARVSGRVGAVAGPVRRLELLLLGQATAPTWLDGHGFRPPLGPEAWARLAGEVR